MPPAAPTLNQPVTNLNGVGPERAALLQNLGIRTVKDLVLHAPRRYEDRARFVHISELQLGEAVLTRGTIVTLGTKYFRFRTKSIFEFVLEDGTGRLFCRWWNASYMEKYFAKGDEVVVFGKVRGLKPRTIDHPEVEVIGPGDDTFIHLNRVTPIYPLTEGLSQRFLRALIFRTLEFAKAHITEPFPFVSDERRPGLTPPGLGPDARWPSRADAIQSIHFPESLAAADLARKRLALDELLELQLRMRERRRVFETKALALPCRGNNRLIKPFLSQLNFKLTSSQTDVLREIRQDMSGAHPMRRLLQGDVGSGKTVVAACTTLMAIESGYSAALMAPTEILAQQHYLTFKRWFEPLGIPVELHTGARKTILEEPASPSAPRFFVGTHALIHEGFALDNLGLVIIDEQHKFGVSQREQLVRKGHYPHLLVMTATPIPRTLGLTIYGDLDISVIRGMPPGRGQVKTLVRGPDKLPKVWEFIREKIAQGRQAYIVYPRVEEAEPEGAKAVLKEFENVRQALTPFSVALIHGRMSPQEKERVMTAFRAGHAKALLATALIEVGVDVPNATVMLVENAEQFGLAQLHQLRGRIGRGSHQSYCILLATRSDKADAERLRVMEQTNDGFEIAEKDLLLRGPGELLGHEQSGAPSLRFCDLITDLPLVEIARRLAGSPGAGTACPRAFRSAS